MSSKPDHDTVILPAAKGDNLLSSTRSSFNSLLHFFVRTISNQTLIIHARPTDTVGSVMKQIELLTGILASEMRPIYQSRILQVECTLEQSGVKTDSSIQLTGRLRSTRYPHAWKIIDELLSAIDMINKGYGSSGVKRPWKGKSVENIVKDFIRKAPVVEESGDDTWDHLHVFVLAGAPAALGRLYISPVPCKQAIAKSVIQLFVDSDSCYLCKHIDVPSVHILLQFCKFLSEAVGKTDSLYVDCRNRVSELLETRVLLKFSQTRSSSIIKDLLPFISEPAKILMEKFSSESMLVSSEDVAEFSKFSCAMCGAIRFWMGGSGTIPPPLSHIRHPRYEEWIEPIHSIFKLLLHKVDECLGRVEHIMLQVAKQSEDHWIICTHLLDVLTDLNTLSKFFEAGDVLLRSVVASRKWVLNAICRRAKNNYRLCWILKHKDVINFKARRNLVMMMFPVGMNHELHEMLIDRSQLLVDSFVYIGEVEAFELHGGIFMEFKNEEASGPGVLREWFCLLCQEIFNPQNALFIPCPNDRRRFFPNPASSVDPLHLKYFGFCGRVIALALMHKVPLGITFDRVFFLQLAGRIITLEDVQEADPCFYMSCKKILEMDAALLDSDVLGLTFVREIVEFGAQRVVELCPGGKDIVVVSKNRVEYINLLIQHRFVDSVSEQVLKFAQGFADMLSKSKLQTFFFQSLDLEDFDRMIGGTDNTINVIEWEANTEYNSYEAKDHQISWFWKIVEGMSAEQRRVLLFFWTSVRYLPTDGFRGLPSKLYIYKSLGSNDHLPTSHTCFYRLCLPPYSSESIMHRQLQLITQEHMSCTFGFL